MLSFLLYYKPWLIIYFLFNVWSRSSLGSKTFADLICSCVKSSFTNLVSIFTALGASALVQLYWDVYILCIVCSLCTALPLESHKPLNLNNQQAQELHVGDRGPVPTWGAAGSLWLIVRAQQVVVLIYGVCFRLPPWLSSYSTSDVGWRRHSPSAQSCLGWRLSETRGVSSSTSAASPTTRTLLSP